MRRWNLHELTTKPYPTLFTRCIALINVIFRAAGRSIYSLELDVDDVSYFAKATLEVLLASVFREAANVDLVQLQSQQSKSRCPR